MTLFEVGLSSPAFFVWDPTFLLLNDPVPKLGQKRYVQTFVFKPTKRIYEGYFIIIISLVCYIVYLSINNGSEGAVLIVNTVLSMLCFAYTNSAIPVAEYYQTEIYLLKNIKSNKEIK